MTAVSAPTLTSAPAMLRPLSGYERLFLAIDRINGFNFGIAVSFRGVIEHSQWRKAFDRVQKRHPLLNAGIDEEDPHRPYFTRGEGLPIPLVFQPRISSTHWQRVMEADIAEPFDLSAGPLLRAAALEDDRGCDLVITANHVVIDGMGVLAFVRDLLCVLEGKPLGDLPVPPAAEERTREISAINSASEAADDPAPEPQPRNRTYASRNRKGKAAISALRLSQEQTTELLSYTRREQTTVGAVISAATTSALRDLIPHLKEADLRLTAALDARPYLGNETGKFAEEYQWSKMQSGGQDAPLRGDMSEFRQHITLDPGTIPSAPDLTRLDPKLIGPVTDFMTFYVDLWLANRLGQLKKAGDHFYFRNPMPASSWADGTRVILGQSAIDFDMTLRSVDTTAGTAVLEVKHVPPAKSAVKLPAVWMETPVGDLPNNWVGVTKQSDGSYAAGVGQETFNVLITVSLADIVSATMNNEVKTIERNCKDDALTQCDTAKPHLIVRNVEIQLVK